MNLCASIFILFFVMCLMESARLPTSWQRCRRSSPNFNECLKAALQDASKKLSKPTPELKLPGFEPMEIPELTIGEGKGAVNVVQHFKDIKLHGITNAAVESVEVDFEKGLVKTTTLSPRITMEGQYDMKGKVLLLPINGKGHCEITLVNNRMQHILKLENFQKKGKTYMKVVEYKTKMEPEKIIFNMENLLGGHNKELENNINKLINENFRDVFEDVRESYETSFGIILMNLANQVFTRVPRDEIFLP